MKMTDRRNDGSGLVTENGYWVVGNVSDADAAAEMMEDALTAGLISVGNMCDAMRAAGCGGWWADDWKQAGRLYTCGQIPYNMI